MSNYLWREISEAEKKKIQEDAKQLILEFGDSLEKLPEIPETFVERDKFERAENEGGKDSKKRDNEFRRLMLKNAPEIKDDCIVAERGKWTQ